ncbi:head-tail connector protein [Paraburkholderia sp. MM5477-R1]|uniref:head-tail connector protein n=1 Tax=Paraburkholderia sp. MM5477-R1 TaxID=2991062 RepID=UPI003D25B290
MTDLVTPDEVKARLRIDGEAMDADIALAIAGASSVVVNYLKLKENPWPTPDVVPAEVKQATLLMVGTFLRDPDGAESQTWLQGYPPNAVVAILYPLRDPALS